MTAAVATSSPEEKQLVTDQLTGLLTRASLKEFLSVYETPSELQRISILAVELSRFGVVNDSVGTTIGDKIISNTAKRLAKVFPHAKAISRLHGDHFGLIFEDCENIEEEVTRLLDFSQRPLAIRGEVIVLSVRIGVADNHLAAETTDELVHAAEVALHYTKNKSAQVSYFDSSMTNAARSIHQLENDLRVSLVTNAAELHQAINNAEFELRYQPIVESKTGKVHAFEALVRWNHPKRGIVSPALFIPMAEQIHVMTVLGSWIIRRACADAMTWESNKDGSEPAVSINVSPIQFLEAEILISTVKTAIEETGIDPQRVKIEITESADFAPSMKEHLEELRALGCKISLDDFGTGFSSIAQLVELPVDYVKIDRSLVKDLGHDDPEIASQAVRLAKSVLGLGDSLELTSIVEGIETEAGVKAVQELGGDLIQGYVFSKPLVADDVNNFIENTRD